MKPEVDMPYNIRIVSTYPPRRCGIATFSRNLANALSHFTGEVGHIRVAAIDNGNGPYNIPVDLAIDQYKPRSWKDTTDDVITRAREGASPTIVLLQHEYGLDPDDEGRDAQGTNYIEMAGAFTAAKLTTIAYLHTVLDNPDEHQKTVLQELAGICDGAIVTTESAIDILESSIYGISQDKLKHIDHGIRMHHPSHYDRLAIKKEFGLENRLLITTLGLLSPDKGLEYGIRAYGRFLEESCTDQQRKKIVYLIGGECHPDFMRAEGGEPYRRFQESLAGALEQAKVKWCSVKELPGTNFDDYDVVFWDTYLDEGMLLKLYGATNVMVLPYLSMQQISSGVLADTLGSGRAVIATKFRYARELIYSNKLCPPGLVMGRYVRGILVDAGEPSVEQIAAGLDYLVFNKQRRLFMEKQAHQRGYQMSWNNTAWALLQYIDYLLEEHDIITGRGITFLREKPSKYEMVKRNPGAE
jgi:glycosyltransferase involved in cell wall biosynthesis